MEPSIKRGLTFWDHALMPFDEYEERVRLVRTGMHECGLRAMVVAGNMYQDADLLWLIAGNVDGVLRPAGGRRTCDLHQQWQSRELLPARTDVDSGSQLSRHAPGQRRPLGAGSARHPVGPHRHGRPVRSPAPPIPGPAEGAVAATQIEDASALLQNLRATPRPRERTAVAIALAMAADAACAAEIAFATGASNAGAVVEAERTARLAGAWDVRILANLTGIGLGPTKRPRMRGMSRSRCGSLPDTRDAGPTRSSVHRRRLPLR